MNPRKLIFVCISFMLNICLFAHNDVSDRYQKSSGITKAVNAHKAYAHRNMLSSQEAAIDMTQSIVNPNFDDATMTSGAPAGWTLNTNPTQSKISTAEKGGGFIPANQNHWQIWQSGSALKGKAYQIISNLPNGKYIVEADVVTTAFGGTISLYANYGKTTVASNSSKRYKVTGIVVDGTLEMGLDFATTGGVTIDYDSFTLQYDGMDEEGYREVLDLKITEAKTILKNLEEGYDPEPINNAIQNAENLDNNTEAETIIEAIALIDKALDDYKIYADEKAEQRKNMELFETLVNDAKAERADRKAHV